MNHIIKISLIVILTVSSILSFTSCEKEPTLPSESTNQLPAAGEWIINASFGTYTFTIDSTGTKIPKVYYVFSNWSCGPVTISGGVNINRDPPWPIEDGSFVIIDTWGGSSPSYDHEFTIKGTYDPPNQKFSGTWTHNSFGTICPGTWEATAPI